MKAKNLASIDIGSNGARLLIKRFDDDETENNRVRRVMYLRVPLRLGKDVFTLNKVSKEREDMMIHMMKGFKHFMKFNQVEDYRACATSAMRDAENGKNILKKIKKETGIDIEIISGDEEANLLASNFFPLLPEGDFSPEDLPAIDASRAYAYVDVGGGSTEVSLIRNKQIIESHSYECGTLRMLNGKVKKATFDQLKAKLSEFAERFENIYIIGSGGNINKLFKLTHSKNDHYELKLSELEDIYMKMKSLSLEDRMITYALKEDRADVIIPAAEIFIMVANGLKTNTILVPNISLADSIVDGLYAKLSNTNC